MSGQALVDKMERVWRTIADLCADFTEAQWKAATDCPGWSVQDQLSHLVGSESRYLGRPDPDHKPSDTSFIRNDIGARNEVVVDWRRAWPGAKVLEEFRELTAERLQGLRAMMPEDFEVETQTPIGPGPVSELLRIRIFDAWVHQQDMRRAVGRPGDMEGAIAEHAMGRIASAMPFVVGKKAHAGDGATVVFNVTGPTKLGMAIAVEGGRAKQLAEMPSTPTVRLTMSFETFVCLGCGRGVASNTLESGQVVIEGDAVLGRAIVTQMNFMI